ncbi:hypothetical protein LIER_26337 [Lithospermum erythrorhizon]|uniref:Uncharacterized protein n=1 Tax=Lithospermum erythrorhizon TaxID=34254 RepID=A0AAV3R804_LITER
MDNALEDEGRRPEPRYQTILEFLNTGVLLGDPPVANKIQRQSLRYTMLDGALYRTSFQGLLLKCVYWVEGLMVVEEMHGSICGSHIMERP